MPLDEFGEFSVVDGAREFGDFLPKVPSPQCAEQDVPGDGAAHVEVLAFVLFFALQEVVDGVHVVGVEG